MRVVQNPSNKNLSSLEWPKQLDSRWVASTDQFTVLDAGNAHTPLALGQCVFDVPQSFSVPDILEEPIGVVAIVDARGRPRPS
jgi:hypothetical protein